MRGPMSSSGKSFLAAIGYIAAKSATMATEAPSLTVIREEPRVSFKIVPAFESTLEESQREQKEFEKQIEFEKRERHDLLASRKDMMSSMNAYSVVLVLLASITFVGFLQPPGGLKQDESESTGTLQKPGRYINNFIVHLAISFNLAVAGILLCMGCIIFILRLPQKRYRSYSDSNSNLKEGNEMTHASLNRAAVLKVEEDNEMLHVSLKWAGVLEVMINAFLTFSLFFCTLAFVYAGYTITSREQHILLRRVLLVIDTINIVLFITYALSLLMSIFIANPLCYILQLLIDWLKAGFRLLKISVVEVISGTLFITYYLLFMFNFFVATPLKYTSESISRFSTSALKQLPK